jgi:hypothetical protein
MDKELLYKLFMKDQPDDVSDTDYQISVLADTILYFSDDNVSVRNMSVPIECFKKILRNKTHHKHLFTKIKELIYLYGEVSLQLEDIIKQEMVDEKKP